MDKKTRPNYTLPTMAHFKPKDVRGLKVKGWRKIFHATNREKKAGIAVLVSDKIDFKTKKVTRDKEEHYIMIKRSIQKRRYNHCKYLCNQHSITYICETNINRIKGGNRMQCIHFTRVQHTTQSKGQINHTENK